MPSELLKVPIDKIRVNPIALRGVNRKDDAFKELVDSIRDRGIINPVSLRRKPEPGKDDKEFELIDGLQRFSAASEVGSGIAGEVGVVPAQVLDRDDAEALVDQVIGNAQRIETKPAEYSKHLRRILGFNPTWTVNELAVKLHKSPTWVEKQLSLQKLAESIQKIVDDGKMPLINAYALAQLPSEEQMNWLERAQTMDTKEFAEAAQARAKEIRDAARKGRTAEPEKFTPVAFIRPKKELETALGFSDGKVPDVTDFATQSVRGLDGDAKSKLDAAARGFQRGIAWVLNLDPASVAMQNTKWDADQKSKKEQKIRRDAEKAEKKQKEAAERAEKAQKEAAEKKAAADALPPEEKPEAAVV